MHLLKTYFYNQVTDETPVDAVSTTKTQPAGTALSQECNKGRKKNEREREKE